MSSYINVWVPLTQIYTSMDLSHILELYHIRLSEPLTQIFILVGFPHFHEFNYIHEKHMLGKINSTFKIKLKYIISTLS